MTQDQTVPERRRVTGQPVSGIPVRRLTAGWHQARGPANLHQHLAQYGPLPSPGRHLIAMVTAAGLTGRGGAAFPTGTKMRSVAAGRGPKAVVVNGMEGEPASEKDQALLARAPHLVLDGAVLAAEAVGAATVHICLERGRYQQIDDVARAERERERAGFGAVRLQVHDLPARYVSSEETSLVRWLNGGDARPVLTPPRPSDRGVQRRPTLVGNVETLAHVALIARFGPDWFREAGTAGTPGSMLVTVSGDVTSPGVYEVETSTPVGEVLALANAAGDAETVLLGGYGGTWQRIATVASLPMTPAGLRSAEASPGAGVLVVLPTTSCGISETARILGYLARQSAQQCGPCQFGLPAIAEDFAQLALGRQDGDAVPRLRRRLGVILGRGACRHPDGAVRLAASALTVFAADLKAHVARHPCRASQRGPRGTAFPVPQREVTGDWR
ncbi:MAG TPA: NADH-ubiquinone oxidoreductase-F iron-sulfur binding region domain-containing protein [Streptosporangiaceae bacterium]